MIVCTPGGSVRRNTPHLFVILLASFEDVGGRKKGILTTAHALAHTQLRYFLAALTGSYNVYANPHYS